MKASEIKTDGTEYAFQRNVHGIGYRVKVIEKAIIPKTMWHGSPQPGWLVEALDERKERDFGGPSKGKQFKATSRQLVALWTDHTAQVKADREQRLAAQDAIRAEEAKQERAVTALNALFEQYGIGENVRPNDRMVFTAFGLNSLLEDLVTAVTNEYV